MDKDFDVCLFFYVKGKYLIHGCTLENAESYGDFLIYPEGHYDLWDRLYYRKYGVDYDCFPRGRIVYRKSDSTFIIYYDRCIEGKTGELTGHFKDRKILLAHDEHYKCRGCSTFYYV